MAANENSKIAKNTIFLYIRMFFTMLIYLYTSRVLLLVLGVSDYGLYNVVAGVLAMFTMFSGAFQIGTQRFLNFAMGENDDDKLQRTFSIALGLHVIIAVIIFILGQTIGLWFVCNYLNIPEGREIAAVWVYEFSLISLSISMLQLPYQACVIAHENMNVYAILGILDVTLKLLVVILLQFISVDKLIYYAVLLFIVHVSTMVIYNVYCNKRYLECTYHIVMDKSLAKEIASYSGWNLLGGCIGPITNQGVNILLNIFCGTVINAARGLSITVNSFIMQFVSNFQIAANPQIVKLFAAKEHEKFEKLIINNSRVSVYLFLFLAIPAYIEIEFLLDLWLGEYPDITIDFVRIIFIQSLFQTLNKPVNMSIHASGRIKWMNIANTICMCIVIPASYFLLKLGYSPIAVYWINVLFFMSDNIVCLYFSRKYTNLPVIRIFREVYLNALVGSIVMFIVPFLISLKFEEGFLRFLIVGISSVLISSIVMWFWGMTDGMKALVVEKVKSLSK